MKEGWENNLPEKKLLTMAATTWWVVVVMVGKVTRLQAVGLVVVS
jgi:hypothetical protein